MSKFVSRIVMMSIILLGVVMVALGAKAPATVVWGIDVNNFLTNIGLYTAVVVALQWTYDEKSRVTLLSEVTERTIQNINVAHSGISNFVNNTKSISYDEVFASDSEVIIGLQYSPRIVGDYYENLLERARRGCRTVILAANPDGAAIKYLTAARHESAHIPTDLQKIVATVKRLNAENGVRRGVEIRHHDEVLRYSFVFSDRNIWVKMYKNSKGTASIPAICIKAGSDLFEFYKSDVLNFVGGAKSVET